MTTDVIGKQETLDNAFDIIINSFLKDVHTVMPGQVTSFDASRKSVSIQPSLQRKYEGQDPINLPIIEDVPVVYPGSSAFGLTFPIEVGDTVVLLFCERALASWLDAGGIVDPQVARMHDLSDAIALPHIDPFSNLLPGGVKSGAIELRNRAGTEYISLSAGAAEIKTLGTVDVDSLNSTVKGSVTAKIEAPAVTVKGNVSATVDSPAIFLGLGAVEPLVRGTTNAAAFTAYASTVATALTTYQGATKTSVPELDAAVTAFFTSLSGACAALATAVALANSAVSKTL